MTPQWRLSAKSGRSAPVNILSGQLPFFPAVMSFWQLLKDKLSVGESGDQEVSKPDPLTEIDTSHWQSDDKVWVKSRKASWPKFEKMLSPFKTRKGLGIIKQYYLRGKMPDWLDLKEWEHPERHLDFFCFIWLHPSRDRDVLVPLRDAYISSVLTVEDDIRIGLAELLRNGINMACQANSLDPEEQPIIVTEGQNEFLFDILMGDLSKTKFEIQGYSSRDVVIQYGHPKRFFEMPKSRFDAVCTMSSWLRLEKLKPINQDMLYQYDKPLEWWYQSCETEEGYFDNKMNRDSRRYIERALYEIYHFDTDKEGDTCRTHFVTKIKTILDEREFIPEFKELWQAAKTAKPEKEDSFYGYTPR